MKSVDAVNKQSIELNVSVRVLEKFTFTLGYCNTCARCVPLMLPQEFEHYPWRQSTVDGSTWRWMRWIPGLSCHWWWAWCLHYEGSRYPINNSQYSKRKCHHLLCLETKKFKSQHTAFCDATCICICSYLSSIHEKANCIAILWTGRPHLLGSCHFWGVWAICLPHKDGGVPLSALPKDTTSELAGLFFTTSHKCRAPSREAVDTIF